jgi:hypothetical protein
MYEKYSDSLQNFIVNPGIQKGMREFLGRIFARRSRFP